ncbi:zinc finger protein 507 [Spea bombifrons]|uniref:zinc finger protein 507 n=1 Tax=Spea bombifrons TaxID=233779 RepID=UPI002349D705|nr:zinc finger protein 507 [Spea bombifrons]XP_053305036.1 zinc finger protein 507 [Spea bombifrons]
MENQESSSDVMPNADVAVVQQTPEAIFSSILTVDENQKLNDPLINAIQKLSTMVKNEKSSKSVEGKKRSYPGDSTSLAEVQGSCSAPPKHLDLVDPCPKRSKGDKTDDAIADHLLQSNRKVMFYQCSLCKFMSPSFEVLASHVKSHGQENEVVLMCSECRLTFKSHDDLQAHIRKCCQAGATTPSQLQHQSQPGKETSVCPDTSVPERKKWYAHEAYGLYRCLICRYTCGQQRMLKTHAWKHAGEVDCSYPIFEEENEGASLPDCTVAHTPQGSESVLSEDVEGKSRVQMVECEPVSLEGTLKEATILSQTPVAMTEVVVVEEALLSTDQENTLADSLLSSAQQIIHCGQNKKGHANVIVERLPGAEETVSQKPLSIASELGVKKTAMPRDPQLPCEPSAEIYHADKNAVEIEEIVVGWGNSVQNNGEFPAADENSAPARRRTNSECLRLHSLAAEALVTMPIRIVECPKSNLRCFRDADSVDPDTGQQEDVTKGATCPAMDSSNVPEKGNAFSPRILDQEETKVESELTEEPIKMGISTSLLKVIEKLKERTDQNATDEDILKELQDNAQSESSSDRCPGGNLVEYLPHTERPYRCRLCYYTSDNKGYIKQHLRVHRQRQPYQCPICEHIADNSNDLENHMINHCKTRTYECKNCTESFYSKSQLRSHEREHRGRPDNCALITSAEEPQVCSDAEETGSPKGSKSSAPKLYGCDVCSYTSSTYVGVRNHRRIHTAVKPYRCQVCNFATSNMNSLKCHMRRYPDQHQAAELVGPYRCSLCGYVCSHPPSLKSHMWKHASDQNYNYEQVNKAINEAMSQSNRALDEPLKKTLPDDFSPKGGEDSAGGSAEERTGPAENPKVAASQITDKSESPVRPGTELCVLLFCCCVCGFESTSKELLMEHMKSHEGEIINIILNKTESPSST